MNVSPSCTAELSPDLTAIQAKWLKARREEQDIIYAEEFAPGFIPVFAGLPLHGWEGERPAFKALVSVLGLSWQPVTLMAAWARPERVLVLGTPKSLDMKVKGEPVQDLLPRLSGLSHTRFDFQELKEPEELTIYQKVRSFLEFYRLEPRQIAVDPTGGKKSMSASAALAGFLAGAWIVYVDYAGYEAEGRIPVAGTEYPRLLRNPLDVFGDWEFDRVRQAFRSGNYEEAHHLAESLAGRLYEPREAQALALMSEAYGSWHRFDFGKASERLEALSTYLERFGPLSPWAWARAVLPKVRGQCALLKNLAMLAERLAAGENLNAVEEGIPLVLNHLAAAERALSQRQVSPAMLLAYSTLERYVVLCLWAEFRLDDRNPNYPALNLDLDHFHEVGNLMHGKQYDRRDPSGPIALSLGVQLLATLKPGLVPGKSLGPIRGIMNDRNNCEFEHGLCAKAVRHEDVEKHIKTVKAILGGSPFLQNGVLEEKLDMYRFPGI
ncbi:MAG: TIGR02710 family CRISPR-associated CARF protein [Thermodesulfobacteriota bacterium]